MNPSVLVTGGAGFIGRHLVGALNARGVRVRVLSRNTKTAQARAEAGVDLRYADLDSPATLKGCCDNVETLFHLAGYAHDIKTHDGKADSLYMRTTVAGTAALLEEAARAGVKRLIFASSVKAIGEGTASRLDETTTEMPVSAYGRAKLEAERLVQRAGANGHICATVLRFPLVYGPGNKGNLPRMIRAIDRGFFPSLPEVGNRRSMLHVDNAVQALLLAGSKSEACGQTYLVTDDACYSTRELYNVIRAALGKSPSRITVPLGVLRLSAKVGDILGRLRRRRFVFDSDALDKLTGSAWYSADKIRRELGYAPAKTLHDAIPDMVKEYRQGEQLE